MPKPVLVEPAVRRRGRPKGSKTRAKEATGTVTPISVVPVFVPEPVTTLVPETKQSGLERNGRTVVGMILGSFVPLASYTLVHVEVEATPLLWLLVAGGLIYSALTVYKWAYRAFEYRAKALGFVVLLEGAMTFSRVKWLGLAGLAILMCLNGVTAAASLRGKR